MPHASYCAQTPSTAVSQVIFVCLYFLRAVSSRLDKIMQTPVPSSTSFGTTISGTEAKVGAS